MDARAFSEKVESNSPSAGWRRPFWRARAELWAAWARVNLIGKRSKVWGELGLDQIRAIASGKGTANDDLIREIKGFSMLHVETLRILWELSARSSEPIIEVGSYMGGATVTMALACKSGPARVITVEAGGSHLSHPTLPSADILADLRRNIVRYGVQDKVSIVEGYSHAPETLAAVSKLLDGQKARVVVMDSDGQLARDFPLYTPFIADDAYIIFDDYEGEAVEKSALVRPFIEQGIRNGHLSDLGVYLWGTWVGRYRQTPKVAVR